MHYIEKVATIYIEGSMLANCHKLILRSLLSDQSPIVSKEIRTFMGHSKVEPPMCTIFGFRPFKIITKSCSTKKFHFQLEVVSDLFVFL